MYALLVDLNFTVDIIPMHLASAGNLIGVVVESFGCIFFKLCYVFHPCFLLGLGFGHVS